MKKFPFNLGFVIRFPEDKVYGFSILTENIIGVIGDIGRTCAENNISIINLKTNIEALRDGMAHIFIAVDMSKSTIELSDFQSKLLSLKGIKEVDIIDPIFPGILIDTTHYPIILYNGIKSIITSEFIWWGIFVGLRKQLGEPVAGVTLWNMGYSAGKKLWEFFYDIRKASIRDVVELLKHISIATGWVSDFDIIEYSPTNNRAIIRVKDNWECSIVGKTGKAESHYVRGILAGFFSSHFKVECQAFETMCISKGDEYCEYEIMPKQF
ncbi:MAG: V4R domain-containing protein [Thermoprotei archaeon]